MKKSFDCVQMKRDGARRVHEAIKGMTVEEEVAFWRQRTEEMRRRVEALRRKAKERVSSPS